MVLSFEFEYRIEQEKERGLAVVRRCSCTWLLMRSEVWKKIVVRCFSDGNGYVVIVPKAVDQGEY